MIKKEFIKPIPKYIVKKILKADKERTYPTTLLRFCTYLTKMKGELVKITVALKNNRNGKLMIKQVAIHGVDSNKCLVRDLEYCYLGVYAYKVGWYDEGYKYAGNIRPNYNDGVWYEVDYKYYDPYGPLVNEEYALTFKQYKYSALQLANYYCPIEYLRLYKQFPQLEYMVKLGFYSIGTRKMILRQVGKDKKFIRWLIDHKEEINAKFYYADVILRAYKTKRPLEELQREKKLTFQFCKDDIYKSIKKKLSPEQAKKLMYYIVDKHTGSSNYRDYFEACEHLKIDMTQEKNLFPHDFKRWHDIRVDQYQTQKALLDAEERKEFYTQFGEIAQKYMLLEHAKRSAFVCIIAKSPLDLMNESKTLHHCVGKMNYDQKFVKEQSLIFFIRPKESPETPFVTVEYSLSKHKILQCRGDHNCSPSQDVMHYVNKVWLPYANKQIQQIAA